MREEILSTTAADIGNFGDAIADVAAHGRVVVLGSARTPPTLPATGFAPVALINEAPPLLVSTRAVFGVTVHFPAPSAPGIGVTFIPNLRRELARPMGTPGT
jgi:hypothetical protein